MKEYLVTIEEILSRTVKVKAESIADALRKVEDTYDTCKIVLDADDFCGSEVNAREATDEDLDLYEELED